MAASDLFKKPNVQVFEPTSRIQQKPSKSCSNFFSKSLVIILVLVVIPLFPSQAPDFINQSILAKYWELLHLLFIGIAVSYGLFSRRSVKMEMEVENQPRPDTSHPYLSGISNVSSFFEDGYENLCNSDEKKMMHNWNPDYLFSESMFKESSAIDEGKKLRSFTLRNGFQNINESYRENVSHIWNSQYFQGESLVAVTDANDTIEEHKPLDLPIRSLRSRIAATEKPEFSCRNGSSSSLKSSFKSDSESRDEKIRGVTPTNLQKKFEEVVGPSKIPWKSRSGRMEMREEVGNAEPPGHSRPHSVGEFEFKQLKSRSFQQPVSSGNSSKSSESRMTTTSSSVSPEQSNLKTGNLERRKDLKVGRDSISHSTVANVNNGLSFTTIKSRGFSIGSSSELDMQKSSQDDLKDFPKGAKQDLLGRGKRSSDSMNSVAKPSNLSQILSRAKSVRTIRSGRHVSDKMQRKEKYSNQRADEVEAVDDQIASPILVNTENAELKDPPVDIRKQNSNKVCPVTSSTFSEHQNREKQDLADCGFASEEDSESHSESENYQESPDEKENVSNEVDDEDLPGSEVDRKADEFIAKFRAQIRLQKIASARKHSGW